MEAAPPLREERCTARFEYPLCFQELLPRNPSSETTWSRRVLGTASSSRPAASDPVPFYYTARGLRWAAINELGGRGARTVLLECPLDVTVWCVILLGPDPDCVDDVVSTTPALFRRGLVSLPRVQAKLVPLCSVVPPHVRSLPDDDAIFPRRQCDCTERFEGRLA